jgi:dipeptidyl aminopeptidase/acylaminoacyl peptidase
MLKKFMVAALLASTAAVPGAALAQNDEIIVTAQKGRVATEVLAKRPNMTGLRLSPDGNKLVYKLISDGREFLAWMDISQPNPRPKVIAATEEFREAGDRTTSGWRWVGNDKIVLTLTARENFGGDRGDVIRLVSYDLQTGKLSPIAWDNVAANGGQILNVDHASQTLLIQRTYKHENTERWNDPEVVRVDLKTGKVEMVMRTNPIVGGWFADSSGVVRGGFSYDPDTGKERLLYRSSNSGAVQTVTSSVDKDFTGAGIKPEFLLPEPDTAIVSDNKSGFSRLYRVNIRDVKASQKLVFQSKGYDVGGIVLDAQGKRVVGYSVTEARARTVYTDPIYKEVLGLLEETFGKGDVTIFGSDHAETKFIFFVAKPSQPGSFYIFDTVSGNTRLIGHRMDELGQAELNPVSAFRYTASDGESIEAIMTFPRHRKQTKGLPLVILTHGGPFGPRDEVTFDPWAQTVAELGYVVVQPNYRGSGGYGAEWIKKGRANGFGGRMQDDLDDVITHLAAQGTIDPKRVCMFGWSYGGYASARAAQRDADKYRCTIAGAGVYDLQLMRDYDKEYLGSFGSNYLAKGAAELSSVSPAKNAGGKWAPILIVHGVRDQRVPVEQARVLVSALKGAGKKEGVDFEYLEQPKNTHNLPYDDVSIEWLAGVERWLRKHNPAYIATDTDKELPVVIAGKTAKPAATAGK